MSKATGDVLPNKQKGQDGQRKRQRLSTQKQIDAQRQSKLLIVAENIATFSTSRPKILILIVALLSSRLTRYTSYALLPSYTLSTSILWLKKSRTSPNSSKQRQSHPS